MEHARKMILMPEDSIKRFKQNPDHKIHHVLAELANEVQPSAQTPGNPVSRLDAQLLKILKSKTPTDDYERWRLYNDVLRRYLFYTGKTLTNEKSSQEEPPESSEQTSAQEESAIESSFLLKRYNPQAVVAAVPQTYQRIAKSLLDHIDRIDRGKRLKWDEHGQVTLDGKTIPNANITDLIQDVVRQRKSFEADGWKEFSSFLRSINTPQDFLGNPKFHRLSTVNQLQKSFGSLNETEKSLSGLLKGTSPDSSLRYSTPLANKRKPVVHSNERKRTRSTPNSPKKSKGFAGWMGY